MASETVLAVRNATVEVSSHDFSKGSAIRRAILSDISLEVQAGETIGIVGANGAGKSTLLRACSGAIRLTSGEVLATSRPHMLAIGVGLRGNLSGRQNIEIGLYALGFDSSQVAELATDIADFAELGPSLDYAVGAYSSGMRSRLGFAIATAARPEVLLIDEALAVGDAAFRDKCYERLNNLTGQASAVLIATHSRAEVEAVCTRAIWLDAGSIAFEGDPAEAVDTYRAAQKRARG